MLFSQLRRRALWATAFVALFASTLSFSPAANASSGFGDVTASDWFGAPVQWLVNEDITTGVAPGCFGPNDAVSRGQLATFLHRYAGEPSAPAHPFTDVTPDRYYNDAVAWLAHEGITLGTTDTTFSPQLPITRGMVAAFLWRMAGSPSAPDANFADVDSSAFYARAVDWMVAEGITNGTSPSTFSPYRTLNRAEFATFLYRFAGEPSVVIAPGGTCSTTGQFDPLGTVVFEEDFATRAGLDRFDTNLHHRDDNIIHQFEWYGDHAPTPDGGCAGPDTARLITREAAFDDWIYWCPNGTGHIMTSIGSTAPYSIGSFSPGEAFTGVSSVSWDVNMTHLGGRQFLEIAVIPVSTFDPQNLPCARDLPCNTVRYDEIGAVGALVMPSGGSDPSSINDFELGIVTPLSPWSRGNDVDGNLCPEDGWCHHRQARSAHGDAATRFPMSFSDLGNGNLVLTVAGTSIVVPGSFPDGPVRVVFKDHNYTQHKSDNFYSHPATGEMRTTWHWDNIKVAVADSGLSSQSLLASLPMGEKPDSGDDSPSSAELAYCVLPEDDDVLTA